MRISDWSSDVCSSDLRRIELRPVIVEAVADLMPDDGADRSVIRRRIGLGVVERRLEDRGREVERVLQRQVDRVHRLRRHPPFAAIDRSEEHTSELQSLMRISYAVFCLKTKKITKYQTLKIYT